MEWPTANSISMLGCLGEVAYVSSYMASTAPEETRIF